MRTASGREPRLVHWLKTLYARPLDWVTRHPFGVTLPSVGLLATSVLAAASMLRLPPKVRRKVRVVKHRHIREQDNSVGVG